MAPDLRFTDYFTDHNERDHNIDEDVVDAYYGRRVKFSKLYERNGRKRREVLAKNDDLFMNIIVEPIFDEGREFWDVLSGGPQTRTKSGWLANFEWVNLLMIDSNDVARNTDLSIWDDSEVFTASETEAAKVHLTLRLDPTLYQELLKYKKQLGIRTTTAAVEQAIKAS